MLVATALSKRYGSIIAVSNVTLKIEHEGIYGIIGPNGAGKSTLFKLLAGFEDPDTGNITFNGIMWDRISAHQRARYGVLRTFQELEVYPSLTIKEVLITAALIHLDLRDAKAAAAKAAARFELPLNALASELSPGTVRRMEVARCVLAKPKLVLFDEVMAGLTQSEIQLLCDEIRELYDSGVDIALVEHVMDVVRRLCTTIIVMANGTIIARGTAPQIAANAQVREAYLGRRRSSQLA